MLLVLQRTVNPGLRGEQTQSGLRRKRSRELLTPEEVKVRRSSPGPPEPDCSGNISLAGLQLYQTFLHALSVSWK